MTDTASIVAWGAPACLVVVLALAGESRLLPPRPVPLRAGQRSGPPQSPTHGSAGLRRIPRWMVRMGRRFVDRHRATVRPGRPSDQHVADWCEALARRVRSGDSLAAAVHAAEVAPSLTGAIDPVVLALERGASTSAAVLHARHHSPGLDAAVTVIAASASIGGPAAEPLDRVATTLRSRVAEQAERRTQSTQARLSALTLTVLPGAMLAILALTSGAVRAGLLSGPGTVSVVTGAVLNLVGWRWMRRIIGGAP